MAVVPSLLVSVHSALLSLKSSFPNATAEADFNAVAIIARSDLLVNVAPVVASILLSAVAPTYFFSCSSVVA